MNRLAFILLSTLFAAGSAVAQDPTPLTSGPVRITLQEPITYGPGVWLLQDPGAPERKAREALFLATSDVEVVKSAPFTSTVVNETSQTLSDGNVITTRTSGFEARDSQGRTRREQALGQLGPVQVDAPKVVFITDPVGHTDYILQPDGQTARAIKRDENVELNANVRKKIEAMVKARYGAERPKGQQEPTVKQEDLGTQEIEGVSCHGNLETTTIPAGQIGNERPIVITTETWTSDDLHGIVLKKHSDPRYGETVYRLTDIKLGEPDASLFKVPSNYKIVKPENRD